MTTLRKANAELPAETTQELINAREKSDTEFYAWVIALRNNKWPYRAIGDVFGVSRVAAQAWYNRALKNPNAVAQADTLPDVPTLPPHARGSGMRVVRLTPDVPEDDQKKMRELADRARDVGRWTPEDSPSRRAAVELEELIYFHVETRKVPAATVARHLGLTRRAIVQRLEKQRAKVAA